MRVIVNSQTYHIKNPTGILLDLQKDGFEEIDLSAHVDPKAFDDCINKRTSSNCTKDIVAAFKVADYLHSKEHMELFGKEIASRIQQSTYNGIKIILNYF